MCGRYSFFTKKEKIEERFDIEIPEQILHPRYNASPSQELPVIISVPQPTFALFRWGLVPSWAKDISIGSKMINARSETLKEKPSFRKAFSARRCLVLLNGFYEWQKSPAGKLPLHIGLESAEPFATAGLWERWQDPEAPAGHFLYTFTIVTREANTFMADIHNRMPVMLYPEEESIWLDKNTPTDDLDHILQRPFPDELMHAHYVSKRVNYPGNDDPSLIQEV